MSCWISYPSIFTSCDLTSSSRWFFSKNAFVTSGPNIVPASLRDGWRPKLSIGSDHNMSSNRPDILSVNRSIFCKSWIVTPSCRNRPPCRMITFFSRIAANGSARKHSENSCIISPLYLCRTSPSNPNIRLIYDSSHNQSFLQAIRDYLAERKTYRVAAICSRK